MALSENCFKESTPDVQNWGILQQLNAIQGFQIPEYDEIDITYYGATNNIETVVFSSGGNPVATLTLTYSVQPPTTNDERLVNVTIS
jgi:hypothetical protein